MALESGKDYPRDECPIYPIFDWHKGRTESIAHFTALILCLPGGSTLMLGLGLCFVACPLAAGHWKTLKNT